MKNKELITRIAFLALAAAILIPSCNQSDKEPENQSSSELPNILWLVTEDMGHYIPPVGDSTIQTPNLSRLAAEGIVFTNLFSISGVCAPSRSAIATGMYPTAMGTNNMRTTSNTENTGLPKYEGVPADEVKMVSEILRMNGYYCSNNYKEDYQFRPPATAWNESSPYAHWRNRKENQPFFAVMNFTETHESGLFEPYGFRHIESRHYHSGDTNYTWASGRMSEDEITKHIPKDLNFSIPPYLPDNDIVRRDMWKMYNNIAEMDSQIGAVLKDLENDGLLDNTIIFFYGDHGGPLPRQKRLVYDSGLKTPLIVRFPDKIKAGKEEDQLLSFVDFAPSLLSLIGVEPPEYMQGKAFLGEYKEEKKREYVYAAADRFDEITDAIRAVRDQQFKYIRNYRPEQNYYLPISYRERIPSMQELLRLRDNDELNAVQMQWFRETKPKEELFDCLNDPHELNNLAKDPAYKDKLNELSKEMDRWIAENGDQPNLPEIELIHQLWDGENKKPVTAETEISVTDDKVYLSCPTKGASIGYKIIRKNNRSEDHKAWEIYLKPFRIPTDATILVQSHRLGYTPSKTIKKIF